MIKEYFFKTLWGNGNLNNDHSGVSISITSKKQKK